MNCDDTLTKWSQSWSILLIRLKAYSTLYFVRRVFLSPATSRLSLLCIYVAADARHT